ncbi:MAG: hypothetical protein COC19_07135 [SAR86 cluster bacterium]|uniref:Arginine biosynthesis bifunctional protein ArgJ n=1 Tax=SAR86 cluster bacterium TaxID=2030880 RepID=A0A2A4MHK6_9GAMM|nr:MAG: hypothetical protein COC19_07135 [SAR86 cluster bacterium]
MDKELLSSLLEQAVNKSFNRITVDGDTSTNDCCILVATGSSGVEINTHNREEFCQGLNQLMMGLATDLIRDAEGASKFITLTIAGGESSEECLKVAYTVAESPLVKTALFASDPNWGRILAAIGRAGLENLDVNKVSVYLGDVCIASNGAVDKDYSESKGQAEMDKQEIDIRIVLGRGACVETVWTSDLSHEYIRINAEYRT